MQTELGLRASDMMTTRMRTVRPDMRVYDAVQMLLKYKISGAPVVVQGDVLIGMLSEKDCIHALMRAVNEGLPSSLVRDVMTEAVHTLTPDTQLLTVAHMFLHQPVRRLPVVRDGRIVGQISRRDLLNAAVKVFKTAPNRESAVLYLSALDRRAPL